MLLIVGGALASGWLALRSGHRAEFLQVKQDVAQGAKIDAADLQTVQLNHDFGSGVPASSESGILGHYATTRLLAGTVVSPAMTSAKQPYPPGKTQMTLSVAADTVSSDLSAGDAVYVYDRSADDAGGRGAIPGQVMTVQTPSGGSLSASNDNESVTVLVASGCGDTLAQAMSNSGVALSQYDGQRDPAVTLNSCVRGG